MKVSNVLLSIIATFMLGIAVGTMHQLEAQVPVNDGSGYVVVYPEHPTTSQSSLLAIAYQTGKKDGLPNPQIVQGILLEETKAGTAARYKVAGQEHGLKPNSRYYGVMQIKLSATWEVLRRWPELWQQFKFNTHTDEEIISKLVDDDAFNIAVASKYLLILRDRGFMTMAQLAMAYNMGPGAAHHGDPETNTYSQEVLTRINALHKEG